jgi:hypothetical protein
MYILLPNAWQLQMKLIDWLCFTSRPRIFHIWRRHHYWWKAPKFKHMIGAQGLWAGRNLYRATPAVTRGFGFSGLIRRTASVQSPLMTHKGAWRIYSYPDPHRLQVGVTDIIIHLRKPSFRFSLTPIFSLAEFTYFLRLQIVVLWVLRAPIRSRLTDMFILLASIASPLSLVPWYFA